MAVALLSLGLGFTAPEASAQEPVSLAGAQRIVSVGGAVTEVVYALGAEDRLVARDSTSSYPPEALALPDTGYMRALSPEGVLAVAPDGLLVIEGSGPAEALDVLKKAGVPLVMVPDRYTAEGVAEKVRVVGKALGLEDKAEDLAVKLEADLKAVAEAAAKREVKPRVLFILSMQGDGSWPPVRVRRPMLSFSLLAVSMRCRDSKATSPSAMRPSLRQSRTLF